MRKWLSIIIPHYNSIELLNKLIDTIPEDPTIEIVVVDDKSTIDLDGIQCLENRMKEKGHIFLHNKTDKKGAGTCRNIGLEIASGEWVLFADADDYYTDDAFVYIKEACKKKCDMVYFPPTSVYLEDGKIANRHLFYEDLVLNYAKMPSIENEVLLRYKFLIPSNKLIKRCLIEDIRFDEVMVSNDVMFSTKIANKIKNIGVYSKPIYCLTKSKNTLTTKKNKQNLETRVKVFIERYNYLEKCLSKKEFDVLCLSGKSFMLKAFLDGYGMKEVLWIYKEYQKNGVKVLDIKALKKDFVALMQDLKMRASDKKYRI